MKDSRFERQIALFGEPGQRKLRGARVTVIGAGGTGSIVIPELALLGVGSLVVVEPEAIEETNRNRHFCARHRDSVGMLKVEAARRMVSEYDPTIDVEIVPSSLLTREGFEAVKSADYVFGCVDLEGVRLVMTELCAAYCKPYIDLATGVEPGNPPLFGGRVCCAYGGGGCLVCLGELDVAEAARDLETLDERQNRETIYGVQKDLLKRSGPSVVSINGVVASLAVTEFLKLCTAVAAPTRLLKYDGRAARVSVSRDVPTMDCYYCKRIWGMGDGAEIERYLYVEHVLKSAS